MQKNIDTGQILVISFSLIRIRMVESELDPLGLHIIVPQWFHLF